MDVPRLSSEDRSQLALLYISFDHFTDNSGPRNCILHPLIEIRQPIMVRANPPDPQTQKQGLIKALNERRVNTIGELRRIERIFATLGSPDLTQPMTSACEILRRPSPFHPPLTDSRDALCELKQPSHRIERPDTALPL